MSDTPAGDIASRGEPSPQADTPDQDKPPAWDDGRVEGVSLPLRLYASPRVHRLIPTPLALALAASVGPAVRQLRNPAERDDAEKFMRDLLLHTPRASEAEALAKEWLKEKSRLRELFWRPWVLKRSRILGAEYWDAAHQDGRGCLIVLGHIGGHWAIGKVMERHGLRGHAVSSPHYWNRMQPGQAQRQGYDALATRFLFHEYGQKVSASRLLPADADPRRLLELLQSGESLAIAFDVAGFAATPFLGRTLSLAGGPATLAFKAKTHVLPVVPERHGSRIDVRFLPPLDAAEYRDPMSLRAAIAQTFEPIVVSRPQSVELHRNPHPLVAAVPPHLSATAAGRAS
jgi:lauroyl/myristoyl acyltransferase